MATREVLRVSGVSIIPYSSRDLEGTRMRLAGRRGIHSAGYISTHKQREGRKDAGYGDPDVRKKSNKSDHYT